MVKKDWDGARALGLPITVHTSGPSPVMQLEAAGLLGPDLQLVHPLLTTPEERAILKTRGVSYAMAPTGEARRPSAVGIIQLGEMLEAGVKVSLSTDHTTNYNCDPFVAMRILFALHQHRIGNKIPLTLKRLVQLVMSDEACHHRFGRLWAAKTIRHLNPEEHRKVEDWSAQLFQMLLFNLINAEQKQVIYAKYGLDWQWVRDAVKEVFGDEDRRAQLKEGTNIFRVLIKTLLHAGIITSRTAPLYAVWVDMEELEAEGDSIPGDVVAEEMLVVLREINARRKRIGGKDIAAAAS